MRIASRFFSILRIYCSTKKRLECVKLSDPQKRMVSSGACGPNKICVEENHALKHDLKVPQVVRGMRELQKEMFSTNITLPVLKVEASKISLIQRKVRLEKYLFKNLGRIKSIMNADDSTYKLFLFDPNIVQENATDMKLRIEAMIKEQAGDIPLRWDSLTLPITFDDWDLKGILRGVLTDDLEFSSYSQVGHIVHVNLRDNLLPYKKIIGQVLLAKVGKCRTVVNKIDSIRNEYRNFKLDLLAGDDDYVTEALEGGVKYRLDFSKVFWNSRLSHEHERIVKEFDSRSLVYDACAGVGPFVLPALKKGRALHVVANDLNPESIHWLRENVALNKIPDSGIDIHNLDAVDFICGPLAKDLSAAIVNAERSQCPPSGGHVLLNLPGHAVNFLPAFRGILAELVPPETSPMFPFKVYCYLFTKAHEEVPEEWYAGRARQIISEYLDEQDASIDLIHHVRTVSSRKEMFCVQMTLSWNFLCEKGSKSDSRPPKRDLSSSRGQSVANKRTRLAT